MEVKQYEIILVNPGAPQKNEGLLAHIHHSTPVLVISPNEMNDNLNTVIVAPIVMQSNPLPTRIPVNLNGHKAWIVFDQIKTIDKSKLFKKVKKIEDNVIVKVKSLINEMLVE